MEETRKQEREEDKETLNKFMESQHKIMINCTEKFLTGLRDILKEKGDD